MVFFLGGVIYHGRCPWLPIFNPAGVKNFFFIRQDIYVVFRRPPDMMGFKLHVFCFWLKPNEVCNLLSVNRRTGGAVF